VVGAADAEVGSPVAEAKHDVVRHGDAPHGQLLQRRAVRQQQPDSVHREALAKRNVQLMATATTKQKKRSESACSYD